MRSLPRVSSSGVATVIAATGVAAIACQTVLGVTTEVIITGRFTAGVTVRAGRLYPVWALFAGLFVAAVTPVILIVIFVTVVEPAPPLGPCSLLVVVHGLRLRRGMTSFHTCGVPLRHKHSLSGPEDLDDP